MSVLKKKIEFSYFASLLAPIQGWGLLCGIFGYILILSKADFTATGTRDYFMIGFPLFLFFSLLIVWIKYYFGFFTTKKTKESLNLLKENIIKSKLSERTSSEKIKKIYNFITDLVYNTFKTATILGVFILSSAILVEWIASGYNIENIIVILVSGIISLILFVSFSSLFVQSSASNVIRQCRLIAKRRGIKLKKVKTTTIGSKFDLLFLILVLTVSMILFYLPSLDFNILLLSLVGFSMTIIINKVLYGSILDAFSQIQDFSSELSKERYEFYTGSFDREIVILTENFKRAGEKIYFSNKKIESSRKELEEKISELERFYNITRHRELRLEELKNELEIAKTQKNEKN